MGTVHSVNLAVVRTGDWTGRLGRTGIDKRPAPGRVHVSVGGVTGDTVVDTANHGAVCQAVYAFGIEDLAHWSSVLGRELVPGNAGENLSVGGTDVNDLVIGQRLRVGETVLRVTGPRIPCRVFAGFWSATGFVKRFTEHGRPGAYFAVEEPGEVWAGASIEALSTPDHGVTVAEVFGVLRGRRRELDAHVAQALDDLPAAWAEDARGRMALATR
ncbi:MOSC domain-containing protein YiiM [Actinoalloteichus hoggarensis]|nr:MOSC domain-containing protein [Actinoalloteichus hoggarensis]MBB5923785.1 MOSC domain-containing protein YiiM [Actinoalloteichus hoggarensis]